MFFNRVYSYGNPTYNIKLVFFKGSVLNNCYNRPNHTLLPCTHITFTTPKKITAIPNF